MNQEMHNLIQKKDQEAQGLLYAYFVQQIFRLHPQEHIIAILAYGSTLNQTTSSETSTPDFYVIVDDYKLFYPKGSDRFLNRHLPPNIYHIHTNQASCKYCVISMDHLEKEVSEKAKDVYHLGRFSKRMGLIWAKNDEIKKRIVYAQGTAVLSVAKKVIQSMEGAVSLEDFVRKSLYLSYQGDVRVEAIDKVDKLFNAERDYYEKLFSLALTELAVPKNELGQYTISKISLKQKMDTIRFNSFIRTSKRRAKLRWPKNMFTVDKWLDYILAKIERTQGMKIEMSPTERKFWYIFGWKYFFRLSRKKLIK